jgi:hypothetical protein
MANPALDDDERESHVRALMRARSALGRARRTKNRAASKRARARIDAAKIALGERGPVWWNDGEPDYNRHLTRNTPYAEWFLALSIEGVAGPRRARRRS